MVGVGSCRRMVVVGTCSKLLEMVSSTMGVESCRHMVVVGTCTLP